MNLQAQDEFLTPADIRPEVMAFAVLMEKRLRANEHKRHWSNFSIRWLFNRLRDEVDELEPWAGDPENAYHLRAIQHECADVANFAMMMVDQAKLK